MPQVSVVIPCFNGAEHVGAAIDSLRAQTLADLEVIVVDDGSTDDTRSVVRAYLRDSRVRYLYQENLGLPGARNSGARMATAEFVAFLDADDELVPDALEKMFHACAESGAAWCLIDILKRTASGESVQRCDIPAGDAFLGILRDDFIRRAMFFRRDAFFAVGLYDEAMKNREDWDINIRMFAAGQPYVYLHEALYCYTLRQGSITRNRTKILNYTERLLVKHHKRLADAGSREVAKIYAALLWGMARQRVYETSDLRGGVRCAWQSLRYDRNPGRVLHPVAHMVRRLTHGRPASRALKAAMIDKATR